MFGRWFRWVTRLTERESDTPEERRLKQLFTPAYLPFAVLGALAFVFTNTGPRVDSLHKITVLLNSIAVTVGFFISVLTNVRQYNVIVSLLAFGVSVPLTLDWAAAGVLDPRWWPLVMVILDCTLVAKFPDHVQFAIVGVTLAWLALERTEAVALFGLYEAVRFYETPTPDPCDCASPPCAATPQWALLSFRAIFFADSLLGFVSVFVSDFWFTRGFATSMRRQMEAIDASVEAASAIATLLAQYDIADAQRIVDGDSGRLLPGRLSDAFRELLFNLESYRPYLPEQLLMPEASPDSPDGGRRQTARAPPGDEGTDICICFTDIQSSTAIWEAHPTGMYDGLRLHNAAIRKLAAVHGGYEVKTIGDSFMLAFSDTLAACRFALELQVSLLQQDWPADLCRHDLCRRVVSGNGALLWHGLRVRVGLHCGPARVETNPLTGRRDYFGPCVNTAARLEAVVRHGGLVGASGAVMQQLGPEGLAELGDPVVVPKGPVQLKGVSDPVEVSVLIPSGLAPRRALLEPESDAGSCIQITPHRSEHSLSPTSSFAVPAQPQLARGLMATGLELMEASASRPGSSISTASATMLPHCSSVGAPRTMLRLSQSYGTAACVRYELNRAVASVDALLSQIVGAVEQSADVSQGVIAAVLSGSLVVTWNTASSCPNHAGQCVHFLTAHRSRGLSQQLAYHVGVASTLMLSGNVGPGRRRFSTVVGGALELAASLAEEAELCSDHNLAAGAVAAHASGLRMAHRAQLWRIRGRGDPLSLMVWALRVATPSLDSKWSAWLGRDEAAEAEGAAAGDAQVQAAFLHAVGGNQGAAELRELASEYPGDEALQAMVLRADKGTLRTREAPALLDPPE
eukprot:TRINITY_DN109_c2_g1_i1.p1 TRINITY_DN109_c2_g1~~TRINITY_DN109_c2_g1_i1.p1  ORF type:complete len:858 (+),score=235.06 TRINITY_DN109_c2_g1_i1:83-2656(+)